MQSVLLDETPRVNAIPTRAFDLYGRIIRVPSNYVAETRTYSGIWDGSFQSAWTDNPAVTSRSGILIVINFLSLQYLPGECGASVRWCTRSTSQQGIALKRLFNAKEPS